MVDTSQNLIDQIKAVYDISRILKSEASALIEKPDNRALGTKFVAHFKNLY